FPGPSLERMMGLEPTTFCMASRRSSQLSYIREAASIASAFGVQSLVHELVGQLVVDSTHGGVAHSGELLLQIGGILPQLLEGFVLHAILAPHLLDEQLQVGHDFQLPHA